MTPDLDIYFNVTGQSIHYDCPEGRPSSVTSVEIFPARTADDGTEETAATGSPTIDTPNATALTAAAGPSQEDPRALAVDDGSNIDTVDTHGLQRRYLLEESGQREWIEPIEVSGNSLELRYALANDYTTSATVSSTRISQALLDSWVQDKNNLGYLDGPAHYRVRWVYVVDSVTLVRDSYFSLVRYAADHEVTADDVDRFAPGFANAIDSEHQRDRGAQLINAAAVEVNADLRHLKIDDAADRDPMLFNGLIVRKVVEIWKRGHLMAGAGDPTGYEAARMEYSDFLNRHYALGDSAQIGGIGGGAVERTAGNILLK